MKIFRQINGNWDESQVKKLRCYNINIEKGIDKFKIYDINLYHKLIPLFDKWEVSDCLGVNFTKKENLSSDYCKIECWNMFGYPMPDDNLGYLYNTYDTKNMCSECGIGKVQKDDFRVSRVPKYPIWGLGWVFDEFFVRTDLYEKIFKPLGIECRPLRKYKKDTVIESYVQLVIPVIDDPLDLSYYNSQKCPQCGETKYDAMTYGYYPLQAHPLPYIYKSKEFFGDGFSAHRKIFVSSFLRNLMLENGMMRIRDFVPCSKTEEQNIKNQDLMKWGNPKRRKFNDLSTIAVAIHD